MYQGGICVPRITLTQFADIVFAGPIHKRDIVRRIKNKDQAFSYYEPFRKAVERYHYGTGSLVEIANCSFGIKDASQQRHIKACSESYLQWLKQYNPATLNRPAFADYGLAGLTIRVNCELALRIKTKLVLMKLYWKEADPPSEFHLLVTALMMLAFPALIEQGYSMRFLQLRPQPKVLGSPRVLGKYQEALEHEAESILNWWNRI
jgi:hypothetical protein